MQRGADLFVFGIDQPMVDLTDRTRAKCRDTNNSGAAVPQPTVVHMVGAWI